MAAFDGILEKIYNCHRNFTESLLILWKTDFIMIPDFNH